MSFPATKFVIPRLRGGTVDRAGLVETLALDIHAVPLTVLHAPAGYGKTTVAAMAAATMSGVVAWLSVDPDDNDPHRFLAGLAAALGPDLAAAAEAVLGDRGPDVVRRAATALLNAVGQASVDIVVVLDEWELVTEPAVHAQLEFLVTWAPPNLHLVVATRHEPPVGLARLRARGLLAERGPHELRFTEPETETLLIGLGLPATDVTAAYRRTEGWPAALRLLATSYGQAALPPTSGDARVFAFLADEVFGRQPPEIRRFLVETSVLTTLSAEACARVTGRDDAADVLAELAGRGLFLTERGGRDEYRYHQLFAEFLRWQLARWPAAELTELHRRAARAETDPVGIARHLADAGDVDAATDLLADNGAELLRAGCGSSVPSRCSAWPRQDPRSPLRCCVGSTPSPRHTRWRCPTSRRC